MIGENELMTRRVRLFPAYDIRSDREAELRATSTFLAVARAVSEFGRRVVAMAGGPTGKLECYTEVPLQYDVDGVRQSIRIDGLICVQARGKDWKALIEVKVGSQSVGQDQFDQYHLAAATSEIDAFVTISSDPALPDGAPPKVAINGHRARKVPVKHLSWDRLVSEALMLVGQDSIEDADQQSILNEWIQYLNDPCSRIVEPPHLGQHWNEVLRAAQAGDLRAAATQVQDVVQLWDGYLSRLGFRMQGQLGVNVQQRMARDERANPEARRKRLIEVAMDQGVLEGRLSVPGAISDIAVDVVLPAASVRYSVEVDAPGNQRARTRINWLLRQLKGVSGPGDLTVKVNWQYKKLRTQASLTDAISDPEKLLRDSTGTALPNDALPRSFVLERVIKLPKGKSRSTAPIPEAISAGFEEFYGGIVAHLREWVAPAPQLPADPSVTAESTGSATVAEVPTEPVAPRPTPSEMPSSGDGKGPGEMPSS